MHVHILGIGGTFMGSLAQLAQALGHRVTGSDANVYPPMSDQLRAAGIDWIEGDDPAQLRPAPDLVVVGNALSRGKPVVEALLDRGLPYTSGPEFLREHILPGKWVLAAAGTHGKTTTASMLAWILDYAGLAPGFLIGGVPRDFGVSARLGDSDFFVVEADEYDSAFFDKRAKFVHYRPRTLILNNLEYDHADIYPDLASIQRQFHHLLRTVPRNGLVVSPKDDAALAEVLAMGCWTPTETVGDPACWDAELLRPDGSRFLVLYKGHPVQEVRWAHTGQHNVRNALAAMAAARNVGVTGDIACQALTHFQGVKRRMELLYQRDGVRIYDDFAHHPTAIATTLAGLRAQVGSAPIVAVLEPRSNTMRQGVHRDSLGASTAGADQSLWWQPPGLDWSLAEAVVPSPVFDDIDALLDATVAAIDSRREVHVVIMSNGGFQGFHQRLLARLPAAEPPANH